VAAIDDAWGPRAAGSAWDVRAWTPAVLVAAVCLAGAGLAHFSVGRSHGAHWWGYATFFLAVSGLQVGLALALLRRPSPWLALGIVPLMGVVVVYVLTRTLGVFYGPHIGMQMNAGAFDMAVTAAELVAVGCLLSLLPRAVARHAATALMALGILLWVLRFTNELA
jgi:hypothetical protein